MWHCLVFSLLNSAAVRVNLDQYPKIEASVEPKVASSDQDCKTCGSSKSVVQRLRKTCAQYFFCVLLVFSLPFLFWIPFKIQSCYRLERVCAICEQRKLQARGG